MVTFDRSPVALIALYDELGRELGPYDNRGDALAAVARVAVSRVPGVEWASVTEGSRGRFVTVTATHDAARAVDEIQYELDTGPCVDAILTDTTFRTGDLRNDDRWPGLGRRAAEGHGVRSMLSFRLYLEDDERIAGLNLYSTRAAAFDRTSESIGTLVATHGSRAIAVASARENAMHLNRALVNSRGIGMAMGVLMAKHKVTRQQAFDLLRIASQRSNRKLLDIAGDVADTGALEPAPPTGRSSGRPNGKPGARPTGPPAAEPTGRRKDRRPADGAGGRGRGERS